MKGYSAEDFDKLEAIFERIRADFPDRTPVSVLYRLVTWASEGRPDDPKYFSDSEDALIRGNYVQMPASELAQALGRGVESVRYRAGKLGVRRVGACAVYSPEEDAIILSMRPREAVKILQHYNRNQVIGRRHRLLKELRARSSMGARPDLDDGTEAPMA